MKAEKIWFDDTFIYVLTDEHQTGKMPLEWFPRLQKASAQDLQKFELWADGSWIHWEDIGEDLSVEGFFTFKKDNMPFETQRV
jgi:Protein of unknown function (DUF2442)